MCKPKSKMSYQEIMGRMSKKRNQRVRKPLGEKQLAKTKLDWR